MRCSPFIFLYNNYGVLLLWYKFRSFTLLISRSDRDLRRPLVFEQFELWFGLFHPSPKTRYKYDRYLQKKPSLTTCFASTNFQFWKASISNSEYIIFVFLKPQLKNERKNMTMFAVLFAGICGTPQFFEPYNFRSLTFWQTRSRYINEGISQDIGTLGWASHM